MSVFAESSALYSDIFVLPPSPFCLSLSFTMLKSSLIHTLKAEKEKKKKQQLLPAVIYSSGASRNKVRHYSRLCYFFFFSI